jgi:hypothetical protein
LLPLLTGAQDPHAHRPHVISEYFDAMGGHADHTHGTMVCDGRYKTAIYHGHAIGELYDLERDPGEFDNLWNDPAYRELQYECVRYHLDAMMATVGIGPPRFVDY